MFSDLIVIPLGLKKIVTAFYRYRCEYIVTVTASIVASLENRHYFGITLMKSMLSMKVANKV
jgi:hypothetical protein